MRQVEPADPYDLQRFRTAQDNVYQDACAELRAGQKRSHWMWFVFPQIRGLGSSSMAQFYGVSSGDEARAFLNDPVLGQRLRECTRLINQVEGRSVQQIFGSVDALKLRSSMTLFAHIAPEEPLFRRALDKFFDGAADDRTLHMLAGPS
jgi:uncharacterized protein (DUF1810 family)